MELQNLTTKQIEQLLKDRKKEERAKREADKKEYEDHRDQMIKRMMAQAKVIGDQLEKFKMECHEAMELQAFKLNNYGMMRSSSKGGFQVTDINDTMKIVRRRDTEPKWDERSLKAVELIKSFLTDTIKKRDIKQFEILMTFLQKNAKGDLEYGRVMDLLQHEDKYDDDRWREGLRLIRESFSTHFKSFGYEFKYRTATGWETIKLNFSAI